MCSANTTHEVGITNDQTHFLLAFGLTAKASLEYGCSVRLNAHRVRLLQSM